MYQALYRKYRPVTFDDVISQEHITTTLKNQIINGKTAHAYLFTGSRGTGKTTCARIFAKALNCENPVNGSPCNECSLCRDADNFALSDIIEIDAASNGSVNDARELREAAAYTPERCRYKVYIIDEVHMLSKDAFNALLKIIEEPPPHIKFIMATTELHKVLPTILSRCQRFDFARIRTEDIAARLSDISAREGISLESDAAALIARTADGGMRDALSILDRCTAFSEQITSEVVSQAAGIAGRESLFALAEAVTDGNCAAALDIISRLHDGSKDMQRLCEELITQFRNIMIAVSAPDKTDIIACLPSELETIKGIAAKTDTETVLSRLDMLGRCAERMTRSLSKRVDMEMCVIRMCSGSRVRESVPETASNEAVERLGAKIAELEQRLNSTPPPQPSAPQRRSYGSREQVTDTSSIDPQKLVPVNNWQEILERFRTVCPSVSGTLTVSRAFEYENFLLIDSDNRFFIQLIKEKENSEKLRETARQVTGKVFNIKARYVPNLSEGVPPMQHKQESDGSGLEALLKKAENGGVPIETAK